MERVGETPKHNPFRANFNGKIAYPPARPVNDSLGNDLDKGRRRRAHDEFVSFVPTAQCLGTIALFPHSSVATRGI